VKEMTAETRRKLQNSVRDTKKTEVELAG